MMGIVLPQHLEGHTFPIHAIKGFQCNAASQHGLLTTAENGGGHKMPHHNILSQSLHIIKSESSWPRMLFRIVYIYLFKALNNVKHTVYNHLGSFITFKTTDIIKNSTTLLNYHPYTPKALGIAIF